MNNQELAEKHEKLFLVLKVIRYVPGTTNSLNLEKNTCHWQSMCNETSLRFKISLREIFFKSGSLRMMEKHAESALMEISQGFGTL